MHLRSLLTSLSFVLFAIGPARAEIEVYEAPSAAMPAGFQESAMLAEQVAAGTLPPLAERLPATPLVASDSAWRTPGRHGGQLISLVGRQKDTRLFSVYGYARLVGYDERFELVPDLLERVEVEDGRIFTLHLRKGHRWSDGHPFTAEDFRYYWEEVALNEALSPTGPPKVMKPSGEPCVFEVIDETTVRYTWAQPNPFFLPALAGARALYIYRPAHYMKQFHEDHGEPDFIAAKVEERGARNWAALHNMLDNLYRQDNIELPVLQPWVLQTKRPAKRYTATRNPYFHRVDAAGRQLPYIDKVVLAVTSGALIPAKTSTGESDLQARHLNFADITLLKQNEAAGDYSVRLWDTVRGSQLALYPNLNVTDPAWQALMRDIRFRRALSLAIDRQQINEVIYIGVGLAGNQSVLPASPLYKPHYRAAWADFDLARANALLDEIGLTERNQDGIRLLPDGRSMEIVVESAGENTEESDVLELIHDDWRKIGIKLFTKPSQREVLRARIFSGETMMSIWFGFENGIPSVDMSPQEFVPVRQHSYQWPKWGQYYETGGQSGEPVDMPEAEELLRLYDAWQMAPSRDARREAWERILEINAEQVYTFGLVAQTPQPVVVSRKLRNVPDKGVFNWDPGAQFGVYRMDRFWLDGGG